jgi:hypothetical protein
MDVDTSIPSQLASQKTKKYVDVDTGEIMYVQENGEINMQKFKNGELLSISDIRHVFNIQAQPNNKGYSFPVSFNHINR